jgi:DNA-directed RNA polymerase specialized sigma24 family protein
VSKQPSTNGNHEIARRLLEQGLSLREVSETFGVSKTTIRRWALPGANDRDHAWSRAWKERHREHCRAYDHQYRLDHLKPCPDCGRPMEPASTRCQACRLEFSQIRRSVIAGMYEDGWPLREIAATLNSTVESITVDLHRLRLDGRVGYRYHAYEPVGWQPAPV